MIDKRLDTTARNLLSEPVDLLEYVDFFRLDACRQQDKDRKARLGQFLTPAPVARMLVSMLECQSSVLNILDAGAGVGSLFAACVVELCQRENPPEQINVTAYEIDETLMEYLQETLYLCQLACERVGIKFAGEIIQKDFIAAGADLLQETLFSPVLARPKFNCAILNPPYRKIQTGSEEKKRLKQIGIESSNLYSAFLAIVTQLLDPLGELVAITPRSFCNGPYFQHFRENFLKTMSLRRFHIFDSRSEAFGEDDVLQENIIINAIKSSIISKKVTISSSSGPDDGLIMVHEVEYAQVVHPDDPHLFIHVLQDQVSEKVVQSMARFQTSLTELGINVSTGRVVDFRALDFLRPNMETETVPLLFPTHVHYGSITWPKQESKKPNALLDTEQSKALQISNDYYVLVKRFSSKEEKKRIIAAVYDPVHMPGMSVGFENHLNYFHQNGKGLSPTVARGLAAYLNSTLVDTYFRQFNGHTQVNATDLRNIRYPTLNQLEALGRRIPSLFPDQAKLDEIIREEFFSMQDAENIEVQENDPIQTRQRVEEALKVIKALGFTRQQQNERSALTLLALLNLKPDTPWSHAESPLLGITPMMDFFREQYGKNYAPNSRETVRRQTVHQFLDFGLILPNPDSPERPINSGKTVYQVEQGALELLRTFGIYEWDKNLKAYLATRDTLARKYAQEREMRRIPVTIAEGKTLYLSPGGQNILVDKVIREFAERYTPGGKVLYLGDTDNKLLHFDEKEFAELGLTIDRHGKMPDIVIHYVEKDWLVLIEAVTSHGPIDRKRKDELTKLFHTCKDKLVFVTTFLSRDAMLNYLEDISWETEVWVADSPDHLIHFNGKRFLGPYCKNT